MRTTLVATCRGTVMALRMEGEFDLATREQLMWRLQDAESLGCNVVEIDASRVTHIDVGSLRVLAQAHARRAVAHLLAGAAPRGLRVVRPGGGRGDRQPAAAAPPRGPSRRESRRDELIPQPLGATDPPTVAQSLG
jgi:ABC-type transporter Mla MlaB component